MLRNKMLSINPDIDFGVNSYTDEINRAQLVAYVGNDITIYGNTVHKKDDSVTEFRQDCQNLQTRYGVWSWNLIEMEIDQLAEINVNADIIQDSYVRSAEADSIMKPTYWSEMDSYHLLNTFSLYCAGRLLQDPNQDTDALLNDITRETVGATYVSQLKDILLLIQDARSGHTWESFRWEEDEYVMTSGDYPAQEMVARAETCLQSIDAMLAADNLETEIPLAIDTKDLLRLIKLHVMQIKQFT